MNICKLGVTFILGKKYWIKQIMVFTELIHVRGRSSEMFSRRKEKLGFGNPLDFNVSEGIPLSDGLKLNYFSSSCSIL